MEDLHTRTVAIDVLADIDVVDATEKRTLSLNLAFGEVQLAHSSSQPVGAVSCARIFAREPGMFKAFINGDPFVDVDREHSVYQVQGRVAHGIPVR